MELQFCVRMQKREGLAAVALTGEAAKVKVSVLNKCICCSPAEIQRAKDTTVLMQLTLQHRTLSTGSFSQQFFGDGLFTLSRYLIVSSAYYWQHMVNRTGKKPDLFSFIKKKQDVLPNQTGCMSMYAFKQTWF